MPVGAPRTRIRYFVRGRIAAPTKSSRLVRAATSDALADALAALPKERLLDGDAGLRKVERDKVPGMPAAGTLTDSASAARLHWWEFRHVPLASLE